MKPIFSSLSKPANRPVLTRSARALLAVNALNSLGNSLSNIFISLYWYKMTRDMSQTLLFNLSSYLIWLPAFILAGMLSKRASRTKPLWIGSMLQMVFYAAILGLGSLSVRWLVPLGILYGIGQGFYWLSVNVLSVDVTHLENRNWFNGINGSIGALTGMAGPMFAGMIVESVPDMAGYAVVFLASFFCFSLSLGAVFLLPKVQYPGSFEWRKMLGALRQKDWRNLSFAFAGIAFRDGVLSIAIWLWVYIATGSENATGRFAFLTTLLSIVSFYLIGRFGQDRFRWRFLLIGAGLFSLSLFGITAYLTAWTLVLYGILSAVARPFFDTPFNTLTFNSISRFDLGGQIRIELTVWREIVFSAARISSVGLLYGIYRMKLGAPAMEMSLTGFLIVVIAMGLLPLFFLRRITDPRTQSDSARW